LLPVPNVRDVGSQLVRIVVGVVLGVIVLEAGLDSDSQKVFLLVFGHVSELSLAIDCRALFVGVEFLYFLKVLQIHGEPVKLMELCLVLFIVLLGVGFELGELVND
jgi:hypothetical protein